MPKLPDEALVFDVKTGTTVQGESFGAPLVQVTTVANDEQFNLAPRETLRRVRIDGDDVVFDPDESGGLYERFNGNEDIQSMEINAVRAIVRGKLHLPKTNVTINALELRFEDANGRYASLCTTPKANVDAATAAFYQIDPSNNDPALHNGWDDQAGQWINAPLPAGRGVKGEDAGSLSLNVASIYEDSVDNRTEPRISLQGAQGQKGGPGLDGLKGRDMKYWSEIKNSDFTIDGVDPKNVDPQIDPLFTYYYSVNEHWYDFIADDIKEKGDKNHWPGYPSPPVPPGEPGDGGLGGSLTTTLPVPLSSTDTVAFADVRGGEKGDLDRSDYSRGEPGTPCDAYRILCLHSKKGKVKRGETGWIVYERRTSSNGSSNESYGDRPGLADKFKPTTPESPKVIAHDWNVADATWGQAVVDDRLGDWGDSTVLSDRPMAFLTPSWLKRGLNLAKSDYLAGNLDLAEERLTKYVELLDLYDRQLVDYSDEEIEQNPDAVDEQTNLLSLRDEMQFLLHRIANNLDYYGNPADGSPCSLSR